MEGRLFVAVLSDFGSSPPSNNKALPFLDAGDSCSFSSPKKRNSSLSVLLRYRLPSPQCIREAVAFRVNAKKSPPFSRASSRHNFCE
jgi:hypothetical protein